MIYMSTPTSTPSSSSSDGGLSATSAATTIVLGVVGGIVLIVIAVLVFLYVLKKHKIKSTNAYMHAPMNSITINSGDIETRAMNSTRTIGQNSIGPMERFLDDILKEKPVRFTPQHLLDFTRNYAEKLGSGGFGIVYKGELPNGMLVAVKILYGSSDRKAEEQFMAEVGTIGRTYHINLVRLYGFCFDPEVKALVYEYMENGSLDQYLFDKDSSKLDWGKLHEIALGTAKGIRYLHEECQQRIIHYDIKPGNVLLHTDFSPKVADFGLAKLCDRENSHVTLTGGRGTPGYAAPELWMPFPVTYKCDVYSFGMLLFEILGRRRNLDFTQSESQEWFPRWVWERFEAGEMESVMGLCRIEEKDRDKAERMTKVALACVQYQPGARPTMSNAVRMLEGEEEIVMPANPFQYMLSIPLDGEASGLLSESTGDSISRGTASGMGSASEKQRR